MASEQRSDESRLFLAGPRGADECTDGAWRAVVHVEEENIQSG